jgi:hypothetical protein
MTSIYPTLRKKGVADLSVQALSLSTDFPGRFMLLSVMLVASIEITETLTITFTSKDGSTYDVVLDITNLSSSKNYVFSPTAKIICEAGDAIKVTCTKANNLGTVYVTILAKDLGKS